LRLIGINKDNKQFVITKIKPEQDPFGGSGAVTEASCDGDTVSFTIKQPFGMYSVTQTFKWDDKKLTQIKTLSSDYSQDLINSALAKALKGDLKGAKSDLGEVMYPQRYLGCGTAMDFLTDGHKASLSIQNQQASNWLIRVLTFDTKKERFRQAATALENIFELMVQASYGGEFDDDKVLAPIPERWLETFNKCEISTAKYVSALNDYGFFLQESGQNDKAVKILSLVVSTDSKRTVAYLNLADAYWAINKQQFAIDNYSQYKKLMTDVGKADKIPIRVKERLK
jgi:hypothetical protein